MMNNKIATLALTLTVVACGSTNNTARVEPQTSVVVVDRRVLPELPPIDYGRSPAIREYQVDFPRDTSVLTVKNTTECRGVGVNRDDETGIVIPLETQTPEWWKQCGEHPILRNSNIFVGFDLENWNILQNNLNELDEHILRLRARIDIENERRLKNIEINRQERERTAREAGKLSRKN